MKVTTRRNWILTVLFLVGLTPPLHADSTAKRCPMPVSDPYCFNLIATTLKPGDRLVVRNGIHTDWGKLVVSRQGTASRPITVTPETPGGVTFRGQTAFILAGKHIDFEYFKFESVRPLYVPADSSQPLSHDNYAALSVVNVRGSSSKRSEWTKSIRVRGLHFRNSGICKLETDLSSDPRPLCSALWPKATDSAHCKRIFENPSDQNYCNLTSLDLPALVAVGPYAEESRVTSSYFSQTRGTADTALRYTGQNISAPTKNRIDHNYYRQDQIPHRLIANGGEAVRICYFDSSSSPNEKMTGDLVDNNLFYQYKGDSEVISSKGIGTRILFNVLIGSGHHSDAGHLSLRGGRDSLVVGNAFFHMPVGIRVFGEHQHIRNNFFFDVEQAIILPNGNDQSPHNLGYQQSVNGFVGYNTVVQSTKDGISVASPNGKYIKPPSGNAIYFNLLTAEGGLLLNLNGSSGNRILLNQGLPLESAQLGITNIKQIYIPKGTENFDEANEAVSIIKGRGAACLQMENTITSRTYGTPGAKAQAFSGSCPFDFTVFLDYFEGIPGRAYLRIP